MKKMPILAAALVAVAAFACSQVEVLAVSEDPVVFVLPESAAPAEPIATAQLGNEAENKLYDDVQTALYKMETEVSVQTNGLAEEDVLRVVRLAYNAPDIFWAKSGAFVLDPTEEGMATFRFEYNCTAEERDLTFAAICQMADKIVTLSDGTLEGVASFTAEWLMENVTYDARGGEPGRSNAQVASALKDGLTVCSGYSKALDFVLLRAGYNAAYITGETEAGLHAWAAYEDNDRILYGDITFDCINCQFDPHANAENVSVLWLEPIA